MNLTTVQEYIEQGQQFKQQGKFEQAISCYQKAIEANPKFNLPYIYLQYIHIEPNYLDNLVDFYYKIAERVPDFSLVWINLGDLLTRQNKLKEAIQCYRKSCYYQVVNHNPNYKKYNWENSKTKSPEFIILGSAKCGTSSLFVYLSKHPKILVPCKKELSFFDRNFELGIDWYLSHFPAISDNPEFLTGESTPAYLQAPNVDRRIYDFAPNTKFIILLRNPVERTISSYFHNVNHGFEKRSLEDVINREITKLQSIKESELAYDYKGSGHLLNSIYLPKIKRWMSLFKREQFLILDSESFFTNTSLEIKKVYDFLGIDPLISNNYQKYNVGSYSSVNIQDIEKLQSFFTSYNKELQDYLGYQFNW